LSRREKEKEELTAESHLGPQLGSDTIDLVKGKVDMRRLSKLPSPLDKVWISYFMLIGDEEGGEFARAFCNNYLNLAVSDDGWRVNKMIQMVAGSKGAPSVGELQKKPNIVARNVTQRDWEKKAREEGKTIVE